MLADGKRIAAVPIVSSASVPAADLPQRTKEWFTNPAALLLAGVVLGATVLVAAPDATRSAAPAASAQEPEAA